MDDSSLDAALTDVKSVMSLRAGGCTRPEAQSQFLDFARKALIEGTVEDLHPFGVHMARCDYCRSTSSFLAVEYDHHGELALQAYEQLYRPGE